MTALNDAKLSGDAKGKCAKLNELAELVLLKDPGLLDEFAPALLEMRVDPNAAVRKTIAGFSERIAGEASRQIASCASCATALLHDPTPAVVKAAVKASAAIFREALVETALKGEGPRVPEDVRETWKLARAMIDDVKHLVLEEKTNDGVRLQATRCLESVILLFHGRGWGAGVVQSGHAVIDLDALATEADGLVGVLLESLQPEQCAKQAGTTTVVMIASAAHVAKQLPAYSDFVLPALCALADAYGEQESENPSGGDEAPRGGPTAGPPTTTTSATAASILKELRSALMGALRDGAPETEPHFAALAAALRRAGAGDEAEAQIEKVDRAAQRKREREERAAELAEKEREAKRRREEAYAAAAAAGSGGAAAPPPPGALAVTPRHLLDRVLGTIAHLSTTNRPALDGFVAQLAPEVLADVVLANVGAIDGVAGRVVVDVRAGMGAGVEGWIDWAVDTDARGMDETTRRSEDRSGVGPGVGPGVGGGAGPSGSLGASSDASGGPGLPPPPPPRPPKAAKPFEPKAAAMDAAERARHAAAALTRVVVAADPSGAVANMGGGALQAALLARLATSRVSAEIAAEAKRGDPSEEEEEDDDDDRSVPPSLGFVGGAGSILGSAADPSSAASDLSLVGASRGAASALRALSTPTAAGRHAQTSGGVAGALLEYLVASLPDPAAHASAIRLLGATLVNETAASLADAAEGTGAAGDAKREGDEDDSSDVRRSLSVSASVDGARRAYGPYARTLLTLLVGLASSDSAARAKHVPRLLLDAPHVPPAATRLLRALVGLPPPEGRPRDRAMGFDYVSRRHTWGGVALPRSDDVAALALRTLRELIVSRPSARAACLELALEAATAEDESVRTRAIRLVAGKLHPEPTLAGAVEAFARYNLGEAAEAGAEKLAEARRLADKASAEMAEARAEAERAARAKEEKARRAKAEAEGRKYEPPPDPESEKKSAAGEIDEESPRSEEEAAEAAATSARVAAAGTALAVKATARRLLLFCALCSKNPSLLPALFDAYAKLPAELRPALLDGAHGSFDGLVRAVFSGPNWAALVDVVADPPEGAETLAKRAIETVADARRDARNAARAARAEEKEQQRETSFGDDENAAENAAENAENAAEKEASEGVPAALLDAAEALASRMGGDVTCLVPLMGYVTRRRAEALLPRLVADLDKAALGDALERMLMGGGEGLVTSGKAGSPAGGADSYLGGPMTPAEILVALHLIPAETAPLKKAIDACGACFERPDLFEPAALAAAMQKMVEMTPLPILFMRTVIQAETVAPGLREFTLGILRALCRRRVWTMDPKLWEGFMRCAKRATPRSFPVLCELPAAKLAEVVAKFPAMREPMRAYANAPAVAAGVPRAIKDVLNQS